MRTVFQTTYVSKSEPGRAFLFLGVFVITIAGLALRIALLDHSTWDLVGFSLPVLERIRAEGFWVAIARQFSKDEYAPSYSYAIALADAILPTATAGKVVIKSVSIFFDLAAAATVFALARLRWSDPRAALGAYAALLFAPTVVLNGAYWGQSDIVYTAFLLGCIYLVLRGLPFWAMVSFGLACAFKPQGAWLGPFVVILLLRRHIRWGQLLLVPVIYFLMALPAIYAGRPWLEVATIYLNSASTLPSGLNGHTANLYLFIDYLFSRLSLWPEGIPLIAKLGIVMTATVASLFAWQASRGPLDSEGMIMAALVSVLTMPQCLPHMHERYFFPTDVFAIALAVWNPAYWWMAALMQFNSCITYIHFLWGTQLMVQPVPGWLAMFGFTNNLQPVTGLVAVVSIINTVLLALLWRALLGRLKSLALGGKTSRTDIGYQLNEKLRGPKPGLSHEFPRI